MGKSTISMVIFHSYVNLPKCNLLNYTLSMFKPRCSSANLRKKDLFFSKHRRRRQLLPSYEFSPGPGFLQQLLNIRSFKFVWLNSFSPKDMAMSNGRFISSLGLEMNYHTAVRGKSSVRWTIWWYPSFGCLKPLTNAEHFPSSHWTWRLNFTKKSCINVHKASRSRTCSIVTLW